MPISAGCACVWRATGKFNIGNRFKLRLRMNILIDILLISVFCNGWFIITRDGMVLDRFRIWLDRSIKPESIIRYIYTPFIGCIICMSSFWGSLIYLKNISITYEYGLYHAWNYPITIVGSAFGNYLLFNLLELIKKGGE